MDHHEYNPRWQTLECVCCDTGEGLHNNSGLLEIAYCKEQENVKHLCQDAQAEALSLSRAMDSM